MFNVKIKVDRRLKLMVDFFRVYEGRFVNIYRWSLDFIIQ